MWPGEGDGLASGLMAGHQQGSCSVVTDGPGLSFGLDPIHLGPIWSCPYKYTFQGESGVSLWGSVPRDSFLLQVGGEQLGAPQIPGPRWSCSREFSPYCSRRVLE